MQGDSSTQAASARRVYLQLLAENRAILLVTVHHTLPFHANWVVQALHVGVLRRYRARVAAKSFGGAMKANQIELNVRNVGRMTKN